MNFYTHFVTNILETFTKLLGVMDNYVDDGRFLIAIVVVVSPMSLEMILGLISTEPVVDVSL